MNTACLCIILGSNCSSCNYHCNILLFIAVLYFLFFLLLFFPFSKNFYLQYVFFVKSNIISRIQFDENNSFFCFRNFQKNSFIN